MADALRERIAGHILERAFGYGTRELVEAEDGEDHGEDWESALDAADAILAIPEIAEALEWTAARRDALYGGTGFVRLTRIDPADVCAEPKDGNA